MEAICLTALVHTDIRCPECNHTHAIRVDRVNCRCGNVIEGEYPKPIECSGMPYSEPSPETGVLHVSEFPRQRAQIACVVGKGPSAIKWREINADVYFTVNEAAYLVDRACYAVRGDPNRIDHRFMEWLPRYVTPMVPERLANIYNYGWWFTWKDIGLSTICLTTLMAIRLAYYYTNARKIVCCGLDALHTDDQRYHETVANSRNQQRRAAPQRDRVKALEPKIYKICQHWNGDELVP